ncbi:hypothetical protein SBOR_4803 [Sclerotinia borealis F-4128]|uniref:Phospholipase/carboxylesterase/thioesterase domain-containing protein n=1 Tax=Sclerotinia borealis (strain F-4128) TaxID=1432307 RepID=W9CG14_SCLBF|nr:hypothetical protein SBOR_4803 [Sclerotinia borealis F-4128]
MTPHRTLEPPLRPEPFMVKPPELIQDAIMLLHGTSSDGISFGQELSEQINFGLLLPHTKLIFPSGSLRKTTVFDGRDTNAWFDIANFSDRTLGEQQQMEGLRSSVEYLGRFIQDVVNYESRDKNFRLFVGGLSQGCAMSMILLLSGELDRLKVSQNIGGFVGLSGWLPFANQIDEIAAVGEGWREKRIHVQKWLRRELELQPWLPWDGTLPAEEHMTIFLAHGTSDEKVKLEWGMAMGRVLEMVGYKVEWKLYEGMGHITTPEELADMTQFIKYQSGMQMGR